MKLSVLRPFASSLFLGVVCVSSGACGDAGSEAVSTEDESLATPAEVKKFWDDFKKHDKDIKKAFDENDGGKPRAGEYLAWDESLKQVALIDMYYATRDIAFIDELSTRIDTVMSLRDDRRGKKDDIRGKVLDCWGHYPQLGGTQRKGLWVCELEVNGMITYPMADFVKAVNENAKLKTKYGEQAARLHDRILETIDVFENDWDQSGEQGFYRFPKGYGRLEPSFEGQYVPYNRPLSLGRAMVRLMEVGVGDSTEKRLRDRVSGMARFFLSRTHHDGQGLTWTFATWNTGTENTSHGSMDASFIALAGKHDYSSVGNGDVNDLIGTFKRITSDDKQVASFVNGHGGSEGSFDPKDANQSCGRWLELAEYDHSLVKRCATVLAKGFDSEQVGYAKTLRYKK